MPTSTLAFPRIVRIGGGASNDVPEVLKQLGFSRPALLTGKHVHGSGMLQPLLDRLALAGIAVRVSTETVPDPTVAAVDACVAFLRQGDHDCLIAFGGGSVLDTAKIAALVFRQGGETRDYKAPRLVDEPGLPVIAIPTTAGTGSETTGVAIFDYLEHKAKTGIAHRYLKPTLGIVDPDNTRTAPAAVAASAGLDVLSHALESYTALPFQRRPRPARPLERPAYQGSNPISDLWALHALELVAEFLPRAVADTSDDEARWHMVLGACIAGIGFGNAGVHLPHGMSYPVAGMVESYRPPGYEVDKALVPHGISVILNTPAVARFTAAADPQRHLRAAEALGAEVTDVPNEQAGQVLADRIIDFMQTLEMPNGLAAVGYSEAHIPSLVEGTLPQHRVTKLSPQPAGAEELTRLFQDSLTIW